MGVGHGHAHGLSGDPDGRSSARQRRVLLVVRAEVLSTAAQAVVLTSVAVYVVVEGVRRLLDPPEVSAAPMLASGLLGLVGNLVGIALLAADRRANLNLRAAFLEVVTHALGSVAVVVVAVVIATT